MHRYFIYIKHCNCEISSEPLNVSKFSTLNVADRCLSPLAECARCGGWVHARCEGADAEKYQILSYLPDSVEYVCK